MSVSSAPQGASARVPRSKKRESSVTVIIPAHNEADGIGAVLDELSATTPQLGVKIDVVVIDNDSADRTGEIARQKGARVITEPKRGKGNALRAGFRAVPDHADYVIMLDGDYTYSPSELPRMLEPLTSGFADAILGSRLSGHTIDGSMHLSHRLANWAFTFAVRHLYRANVTDICTGYFAWNADVLRSLAPELSSTGFNIETEMVTKMARMGYRIYSVPITYQPRQGKSKLSPFKDTLHIVLTIARNLRWKPNRT